MGSLVLFSLVDLFIRLAVFCCCFLFVFFLFSSPSPFSFLVCIIFSLFARKKADFMLSFPLFSFMKGAEPETIQLREVRLK